MRHRSFILLAAVLALLLFGAVAVYAYDRSLDDRIAEGITVGGVDVGGMRVAEARTALQRGLADPLEEPLTVVHGEREFTLSPERARLRADVEGMVQEALARSRRGNLIGRVVRDLAGGEVKAKLPPRVSFSRAEVARLVRRVKRALDRPARDATVAYSGAGLQKVPAKDGVVVRARELEHALATALVRPAAGRVVEARTKTTRPKVATDQLASRYPYFIIVSRATFQLRFYRDLKLAKTYRIAVGQVGYQTPSGLYHIQNKGVNVPWHVPNRPWAGSLAGKVIPAGAPNNPIKARWMGIYAGAGIHGTDAVGSLGTAASHGCIRMAIPEVIELYDKVPLQTPVFIA